MKLKAFIIIQGQGNGHMSQAISYCETHNIEPAWIVVTDISLIKSTYLEQLNFPYIGYIDSPKIIIENNKPSLVKTIISAVKNMHKYYKSYKNLKRWINEVNPDLIVNFYEPIAGLSNYNKRVISVSNQLLIGHKDWIVPKLNIWYYLIVIWNYLITLNSSYRYIPSFIGLKNYDNDNTKIIAPLIPNKVKKKRIYNLGHTIIYLSLDQYKAECLEMIRRNKDKRYIWYVTTIFKHNLNNLTLKQIGNGDFQKDLATCDTVISTAGFQMISEALYYGKNIFVIPLHFEQKTNGMNLEAHHLGKMIKKLY